MDESMTFLVDVTERSGRRPVRVGDRFTWNDQVLQVSAVDTKEGISDITLETVSP